MTVDVDIDAHARYRELLLWAYEGEVSGEAMLRDLQRRGRFPEHGDELEQLVELERVTADLLVPLLAGERLAPGEDVVELNSLTTADGPVSGTWAEFLAWTREIATEALPRFRELVDVAPASATAVALLVRQHEEVLWEYADRALRSDREAAACISEFISKVGQRPDVQRPQ